MKRPNYETDEATFPSEAYAVKGYRGIAWRVYGWELETIEHEWDESVEIRTGRVVCVMVGDDKRFTFEPEELTPLGDLDYCQECGQVGCRHDGRERDDG